jgi:hypothetical protein
MSNPTYDQEETRAGFIHFPEAYASELTTIPAEPPCACQICVDNDSHTDCCVQAADSEWPSL